jgi:hypothetical protein
VNKLNKCGKAHEMFIDISWLFSCYLSISVFGVVSYIYIYIYIYIYFIFFFFFWVISGYLLVVIKGFQGCISTFFGLFVEHIA